MRIWTTAFIAFVLATSLGASCTQKPPAIVITSHATGIFTTAGSITVSGTWRKVNTASWVTTINGAPLALVGDGTWTANVTLDSNAIFNPILVQAVNTVSGLTKRDRIVVVAGNGTTDGDLSLESVALRLNDTGLDAIEPVVGDLVDLDIATLLPSGTTVISDFCAIDSFAGCLGRVDVQVVNPAPSFSSFALDVDSQTNFAEGDVFINDVEVNLRIIGSGLAPTCDLTVSAAQTDILGDFALQPDSVDPSNIDVNLLSTPTVNFTSFQDEFTSGICDFPLIGSLVQAIIGDIQPTVTNGLRDFLDDPDGSGPLDAPIAEGIETALADISITGEISNALGNVDIESPLFDVAEDTAGITLGSDSRFLSNCTPPPEAPDLLASYDPMELFPAFGGTTPVGGVPYGLGLCVSTAAFNQLLKAQVECGLLVQSLTEIDLGFGLTPITAQLLSAFDPAFTQLPPTAPLRIDLRPTLAPIVTGASGPLGELGELKIAGLAIEVVLVAGNELLVAGEVDTVLGLDMAFDDITSSLAFTLGTPTANDVSVAIVENNIGVNATVLEQFILPPLLVQVLPGLASSLDAFPLPAFLGLDLQGVEVSRNGAFMSLFADLVVSP